MQRLITKMFSIIPKLFKKLEFRFSGNIIGIFLMLNMVLAGLIMTGLVKLIVQDIDFRVLVFGRFFFSLPILYFFGWFLRGNQILKVQAKLVLSGRIFIGIIGMCLWFSAIQLADFGQVTAITQSSAVFVALFAPIFLNEKVGMWRWTAIFLGLFGIILITNPFDDNFSTGIYYALGVAISSSMLAILLRKLGKSDEPITVAIWHNTIGAIIFSLFLIVNFPDDLILNFNLLFLLAIIGIAGSALQICFTYAFKYGEAVVLTPIRYLAIPGAVVVGFIFWNEIPSKVVTLGMIITIFSCVIIAWREFINNNKLKLAEK